MSQSWRCSAILKKGPYKGKRCVGRAAREGSFCRKHGGARCPGILQGIKKGGK